MMEAALLSVTPGYIGALERENDPAAPLLRNLKEEIERPLAAILTLNTIAHTVGAAGAGAQAAIVFGDGWVGLFSAVLTFLILVISEIIPKTLGASYWRQIAPPVARALPALIALSAASASAQEKPEAEEGLTSAEQAERTVEISCRDPQGRPESWLDRTHSYLSRKLCEPAAWFDGFFGSERAYEETPVGSFFRVRNSMVWDESEDFGHEIRLSANISLPRVSDRVRLLISRDESIEGDGQFEDDIGRGEDEEQTRLGLRFLLSGLGRTQLDADATVKVDSGALNPRARGRLRHVFLVHGEPQRQQAFQQALEQEGYRDVHVPDYGETVRL